MGTPSLVGGGVTGVPSASVRVLRRFGKTSAAEWVVGLLVVLLVSSPMLFTKSGFMVDFTNHLWAGWVEGRYLWQTGHPVFFMNVNGLGVFYPFFAFYGGTAYLITGAIGQLLGDHPIEAYVGVIMLAVGACYGSIVWLAKQLGVSRWMSHVPGLVVVTSAYYVTDLYGRGDWAELMATSMIGPVVASAFYLARSPRWRLWPVLAFVASTVLLTGTHNLTLVWSVFLSVVLLALLWLFLGRPIHLPWRRLGRLAALGVGSGCVNAWFLLPDVAYESKTGVSLLPPGPYATSFDIPGLIFNPLRQVGAGSTSPALYDQIPEWFLVWALVAAVVTIVRPRRDGKLQRGFWAIVVMLVLLLLLLMITRIWLVVPFPLNQIQFPYRINSYIAYAVAGVTLVAALGLTRARSWLGQRPRRSLQLGLAAVTAVSIGLCVWQEWVAQPRVSWSYTNRAGAIVSVNQVPQTWYDPNSYKDISAPIVKVPAGRSITILPADVQGDHFSGMVDVPPGMAPIATDIAGGTYLVKVKGLVPIGRDAKTSLMVVRRTHPGSGPVHVEISTSSTPPVILGRVVSLVALAGVLLLLLWFCLREVQIGLTARRAPSPT